MFIRIKKLKGFDYAYLVKNTWTKDGPRQKTKKYLGRCIILEKKQDKKFSETYDIDRFVHGNALKDVISALVKLELENRGFSLSGKTMSIKIGEETIVAKGIKIYSKENKNDIVVKMNEGYLCEYNLKKILNFHFKGEDDYDKREEAVKFANLFVSAGFSLEKEVFIEIYRKVSQIG